MRRIRVAEPEPAADELQRSLNALHSIGQQAARLEQMATTVSSNSASRTNLFESSQYQPAWGEADLPASAWGEDADAYRGHIEARAGARSPTPDHMRGRVTYDDDDDDDDDDDEEEEEADYHEPMPADDAMQAEARQLAHEQLDELFAEDEFNLPLLLWLMAGLSQEASPAERAKGAEAAEHLLGALSLANGPEALPGADELEEEEELDMERLPLAMVQHMCLRKGMDASGSRQQLIDRLEQRELQERFEEMGHPRAVAPPQPPPAAATAADWQQRAAAAAAAAAAAGAAGAATTASTISAAPAALSFALTEAPLVVALSFSGLRLNVSDAAAEAAAGSRAVAAAKATLAAEVTRAANAVVHADGNTNTHTQHRQAERKARKASKVQRKAEREAAQAGNGTTAASAASNDADTGGGDVSTDWRDAYDAMMTVIAWNVNFDPRVAVTAPVSRTFESSFDFIFFDWDMYFLR
jgi:hypothetical protein